MKLGRLEVLMARLALAIPSHQFHELVFGCSQLSEAQKAETTTPIKLLIFLKARSPTVEEFLRSLESHFDGVEAFQPLSDILKAFRGETVSEAPATMTSLSFQSIISSSPPTTRSFWFKPQRDQKLHFRKSLLNISNCLSQSHLDVMVALSPIPEIAKEKVTKGYQLFEELQRYGCISENDTELLDQFFTLLNLQQPQGLLQAYQQQYPPVIDHSEPPPSAPLIRSHSDPWAQSGQSSYPPVNTSSIDPYGGPSCRSLSTLPPSSFPYQHQPSTPSPLHPLPSHPSPSHPPPSHPSPSHPSPSHPPPSHPPPSHPPPSHSPPPPTSPLNSHQPSSARPPVSSPDHHQPVSPHGSSQTHTMSQSGATSSHSRAPIPESQAGDNHHHHHWNQPQGYSAKWGIPSTNLLPPRREDAFARPIVSRQTSKTQEQYDQPYPRPFFIVSPQTRSRKRTRDESSEASGGVSNGDQSPSAPEKHPRHSNLPAAVSPGSLLPASASVHTEGQHNSSSPPNTCTTTANASWPPSSYSSTSSMTPHSSSRFVQPASEEVGHLIRTEDIVAGRLPHSLSPNLPQEEEQHSSPTKLVRGNRSWNIHQRGSSRHHSNELNKTSRSLSCGGPSPSSARSSGYDLQSGQVGFSETATGKPVCQPEGGGASNIALHMGPSVQTPHEVPLIPHPRQARHPGTGNQDTFTYPSTCSSEMSTMNFPAPSPESGPTATASERSLGERAQQVPENGNNELPNEGENSSSSSSDESTPGSGTGASSTWLASLNPLNIVSSLLSGRHKKEKEEAQEGKKEEEEEEYHSCEEDNNYST